MILPLFHLCVLSALNAVMSLCKRNNEKKEGR